MSEIKKYLETKPQLTREVVCFLIDKDKVILGLRKKVSWGLGANLITGIGGKVGDVKGLGNETDEEALTREVQEEVGVKITSYKKVGEITFLFPNKPKWNQFVLAYIINAWQGELKETEAIKPMSFQINDLPQSQMWDDNQYWVPLLLAGKKVRAVFLYGEDNRSVLEKSVSEIG